MWRLGDMQPINTLLSEPEPRGEDTNAALFHPAPGHGIVYGTKQGQLVYAMLRNDCDFPATQLPSEEVVVF